MESAKDKDNAAKKAENEDTKSTAIKSKDNVSDIGDLLDNIILTALHKKASDVHIEPTETDMLVRYRIDGLLQDILLIDKSFQDELIFKIKISSRLRTDEHFSPQDGRITFKFQEEGKLDTRISILPTTKGEKVVIRLLTRESKMLSLEQLGMNGKGLELVKKSYIKPWGMILAVGPTGSGKTTTLYSILQLINSREKNITTIEDPVEFDIDGINHIQVNPNGNLTFATGLRSILRQDPDIVMVGEVRDTETARIAINAAMTGHLVLSTLHTNDAVTTVPRLIDMGVEPYLVASTVNIIIAQRLARLLCTKCNEEYELTKKEIDEIAVSRPDIARALKAGEKLHRHVGCKECSDSGYKGRVGLYEIMEITKKIREIINNKDFTIDELYDESKASGLITILEDGLTKMKQGIVDIPELIRVTALNE
jgi:type IV pilus assembly protein PilB